MMDFSIERAHANERSLFAPSSYPRFKQGHPEETHLRKGEVR